MTADTLIVYASHHGFTRKCALLLKEKLGERADLSELKGKQPDPTSYQCILIGSSIHAGSIQKSIKRFCFHQQPLLLKRKIGLFLSCMEEGEKAQQEFDEAYPDWLRNHARAKAIFGGAFDFERMNAIERFIIRKISGVNESVERFDPTKIDQFIKEITTD